ncbi:MAG: flagellar basal body-associated protein FliL [Planctomycetota bacterium]
MADDTKKEADGKGDGAKKKGLPPIILIAVGAAIGGAGVVFAVPPKQVEVPVHEPVHEFLPVQHPDLMEFQFNPRTAAGKKYASASFYFVYVVRDDMEAAAFESIKSHWDRARSNVLELLGARTMEELNAENGKRVLAKDLVDELNATLFPGGRDEKVAQVTEILWSKWIVQ